MADTQRSMVSIVAIIAIVVLVGIVVWFLRRESEPGLEIDIGGAQPAPVWVASAGGAALGR
jgi:hypothetical protein